MRRCLTLGPSAFTWQKICFDLSDSGLIEYDNPGVTVVYPATLLTPPTHSESQYVWPENEKVFNVAISWMKWSLFALQCRSCTHTHIHIHTKQDFKRCTQHFQHKIWPLWNVKLCLIHTFLTPIKPLYQSFVYSLSIYLLPCFIFL